MSVKNFIIGTAILAIAPILIGANPVYADKKCKDSDIACKAEKAGKNTQKASNKAAKKAEKEANNAAKKAEQEFNKFKSVFNQKKLSREECLKILRAARGVDKLSQNEEKFLKSFLSQKKSKKNTRSLTAIERQKQKEFFDEKTMFQPIKEAFVNVRNKREEIIKIFTPQNMCEKSGNWFAGELRKLGAIPAFSFKKAEYESEKTKNFALHDLVFSPAKAKTSKPKSREFFGWGISFDVAAVGGVTFGYEVVFELAKNGGFTNEAHTYVTTAPTINMGGGVDVAVGFMWYGTSGMAPAYWDSFPGWGSTEEYGPELPSPAGVGPGINYIRSHPLGVDTMGQGFSVGAGVSIGMFSYAPIDYTWLVK